MITEAIDFRYLLLENYKKINLNETETLTILMADHLINEGNPLVTGDLLALKMSLTAKELDNVIGSLVARGFISYPTVGNKTVTSLDPIKKILFRQFQLSAAKEEADNQNKDVKEQLENIYASFQNLLGRSLSPVEISKIREWVSFGYDDQTIINALKEAINKKSKSLRSVDKILLAWSQREDIEKEGITSKKSPWDINVEETVRIADIPWIKKDSHDK